MSKVEKNLQNIKRSRPTQLRNGNEVAFFEGTSSYMLNEKDRKGEYETTDIEVSVTKLIALRLHQLELGQKKILRALSNISPSVKNDRMDYSRKGKKKEVTESTI